MYLGIDVGGTHTDAVALEHGEVVASCKVVTDHDNLLVSVRAALDVILSDPRVDRVRRLNLSTTLSTNAIVEGKTEDVGVLVSAGPGINPVNFHIGRCYNVISGSIDHRGVEAAGLNVKEADRAAACCRELGLRVFAAVSKFSTRNPAHENLLRERIGGADFISLGHRMSGLLNFPRRISTAYYNSAVWRVYNRFADAIAKSLKERGIDPAVNILKADGGTMPFALSREMPVESILSGPAASVMGIIALCDIEEDCVILDIGGTTTDIAVFAKGAPVIEASGIEVGSYPTLVRALKTMSIGVGGDSKLRIVEGRTRVGPDREGPSMCMGGKTPTLMDAFNLKRSASVGDRQASYKGLEKLASLWDKLPEQVAEEAIEYAVKAISKAVDDMVWRINQKPVYTIFELLEGKVLKPRRIYCMGGPARVFRKYLAKALDLEVVAPEHYEVANAIGAALTRTTTQLELFADTEKKRMFIPSLDVEKEIPASYGKEEAEADAVGRLLGHLKEMGVRDREIGPDPVEITESNAFNMVDLSGGRARNIRVKCQIRPGVVDFSDD